jgi:hypothetical protein
VPAKESEKMMLVMVKAMEQGEEPTKGKVERRKGVWNFSPLAVLIDGLFLISKRITLDAMMTIFYQKAQGWTRLDRCGMIVRHVEYKKILSFNLIR